MHPTGRAQAAKDTGKPAVAIIAGSIRPGRKADTAMTKIRYPAVALALALVAGCANGRAASQRTPPGFARLT